MRLRTTFLWSMIVSLSLAALLGIVALLLPRYRLTWEIIGSTALFAAFSLVALCCTVVLEKRRLVPLMWTGIATAGSALAVWLVMIWFGPWRGPVDEELLARTGATLTILAIWATHLGLHAIPRFDRPMASAVRWGTVGVWSLLAALAVTGIWFEDFYENFIFRFIDEEWFGRLVGALGILGACGTIITPILWKVQAVRRAESAETIPARLQLQVTCPRCQSQQQLRTGTATCTQCGLRITIAVEEPRCACGYLLYRLESNRCPECGREIAEADRWAAT